MQLPVRLSVLGAFNVDEKGRLMSSPKSTRLSSSRVRIKPPLSESLSPEFKSGMRVYILEASGSKRGNLSFGLLVGKPAQVLAKLIAPFAECLQAFLR